MNAPVAPAHPRPAPPSLGGATLLVAGREITTQLRSKAFLISSALLLLAVLAGIVASSVLADRVQEAVPVAAPTSVAAQVDDLAGIRLVEVADDDAAIAAVRDGSVEAAVLPGTGSALRLVVLQSAPEVVVDALTVRPDVEVLEPARAGDGAVRYVVSLAFGLVFMMAAITFGSTIAQNTVTEKQTRVVEILLSAVPVRALLAGKVLGNSVLALGQIAALSSVAVIGLAVTGRDDVLTLVGAPVAWFVVFFAVGFVLLAAIYAASASLVSRMEDLGAVIQPVTWLTITPYFVVVFFNDNPTVLAVASYVPFSAPVAMPVRLFLGGVGWAEPLISLVLLVACTVAVVMLAARIYERSVLRTGGRVKLGEALRSPAS
ncbi:MAG: ABC transporter permease [Cellulomonas sp.]|nr:ABC transporter permease [Cellulomonas sp.]